MKRNLWIAVIVLAAVLSAGCKKTTLQPKERVSPDDNENKNDGLTIEVDFLTASGSGYEGLNQSFAQMNM